MESRILVTAGLLVVAAGCAAASSAADWYVAAGGTPQGKGTRDSAWDLESALAGKQNVRPGDTVWILAGTYKHPHRKLGSPGYVVQLAGSEGQPIHVRGEEGRRVTLDGGLTVQAPSTHLWIRDLEILVSENFSMPRSVNEPGSHPSSYNRPWGGLNVHSGTNCKYINLVIHDNAQGVSFWSGATDSELHACIIYDNGWKAPDRGHGHAVYTQNQQGVKVISDCIMTGGFSYTMHAYGSERAYVDNYLIDSNICYDGGTFLVGGGRPSRNIRVRSNVLYNLSLQIGYDAPYNEDCEIRDNLIVNGDLRIQKYKKAITENNVVLRRQDPRPADTPARVALRPNRYDARRAHIFAFNWSKKPTVELSPRGFLAPGDRYRLMDPRKFYGEPVVQGTFDGTPISLPVKGEFAAFVLLKAV